MDILSTNGKVVIYAGLSTETKPTDEQAISMFIEFDTGKVKYFNTETNEWAVFGGGENG